MKENLPKMILKSSRKYFIFVIILAICCSILGAGIKYMFTDTAVRNGDYLFLQIITLQNRSGNIGSNFDYVGFWRSSSNLDKFISNVSADDFDFTKVDSAWNRKSRSQQIDWIKNNIIVSSFKGNVCEIGFKFDGNITPDSEYMNSHLPILSDQLVKQSEKSLEDAMPEISFETIGTSDIRPTVVPIDRQKAAIKYGILGFVVGGILGEIIVVLEVLRRRNFA